MFVFNGQKYYTLKEISELIHMHINTIRSYVHSGKLKATKIGKSFYVTEKELEALVKGKINDH